MSGGEVNANNLSNEILRLNEISVKLKQQLQDTFVKTKDEAAATDEAPEPNPIDYLIRKTLDSQYVLKECIEILEREVINKLEGGS